MSEIILSAEQQLYQKRILSRWLFSFFMLLKLPMAWMAGLHASVLTSKEAQVQVKFKWMNQNPFKSIYFAVLSMAAEMSTGLLVMMYIQDKSQQISMLVTGCQAQFTKKAVGTINFICVDGVRIYEAIELAKRSKEGVEMNLESVGYDQKQQEVARFQFKWSVKVK
ncbi:MAG: DUF4442 domain-containing protein [Bacteroidota bacterium]